MPIQITPFTTTPSRQNPATFSVDMDARLAQENSRIVEMNAQSTENNTINTNVNAKEISATASAASAANSALAASASANFKGAWIGTTAYMVGQSVLGTDNVFYVCLVSHTNQNPTTTSGYWKVNVPLGAIGNINSPLLDMPLKNSLAMKAGVGSATFTRASTATYIDRYGVLKSAAINEPRFEKEGYLNEGASTNLLTYSEQFNNAIWSKVNVTVTADTVNSSDGTLTADKITATGTSTINYIQQSYAISADNTYAISYDVKYCDTDTIAIGVYSTGGTTLATIGSFTFSTKTITGDNIKVIELADGWFRLSIIHATVSNTAILVRVFPTSTILPNSETGSVYASKVQLEALPFASSYIPTTTAAATRAADNLTLPASGNYNLPADKKTIILDYDILGYGTMNQTLFDFTNTSQYNRILSFAPSLAAPADRPISYYGGGALAFTPSSVPTNTKNRLAYLLPSGTATQSVTRYWNGVYYGTTSQAILTNSAPTTLYIGRISSGLAANHYGHITNVRVFDEALTATEIALA